jgi:hypothetical protein
MFEFFSALQAAAIMVLMAKALIVMARSIWSKPILRKVS